MKMQERILAFLLIASLALGAVINTDAHLRRKTNMEVDQKGTLRKSIFHKNEENQVSADQYASSFTVLKSKLSENAQNTKENRLYQDSEPTESPTVPEETPPETPTEPETPSQPETPTEPETPPETPSEPETPPETPTEPATPPETPAEPETPPETPTEPATPPETPTEPATPPETPPTPETPPETPSEPVTPPETPTTPETPTEPTTPPETPTTPETPPETPTAPPETPAVPEPTVPDTSGNPNKPKSLFGRLWWSGAQRQEFTTFISLLVGTFYLLAV